MQAIAMLVHDDPYLKMPKEERIARRRQRRDTFRQVGFSPDAPIICLSASIRSAESLESLEYVKAAPVYLFEDPHSMMWCHDLILASQGIPSKVLTPIEIVKLIQIVCAEEFGTTRAVLVSHRRNPELVRARQIAIYLTRSITFLTFPQIGRRFGRDHSTCIYSFSKIEMLIEADPKFAFYIKSLRQKVGA
jgi:hypothetical protein